MCGRFHHSQLHADTGNSINTAFYEKDIAKICRGLDRWTSTLFHRTFRNCGQILTIGVQRDGISCRICVLNALEHALFGVPLFTQKRRNFLRVQYFTDIAKSLLDHVSASHDLFGLKELTLSQAPALRYHNTIDELVEFHPIMKSWELKRDVLKDDPVDEPKQGNGVHDVDVEGDEVDEMDEVELDEVEDIDGADDEISVWSNGSTPSSPAFSIQTDPGSLPPPSEASVEPIEISDDGDDGGEVRGQRDQQPQKRKASGELTTMRWKVARKDKIGTGLDSGDETDDDGHKRSRSAIASRRLRELAKATDFVVDEKKRKRFEEKCIEIDRGAKFRYQGASWQVLHSKCLRWFRMTEPYNTTRFKAHIGACKAKGEERNTSITNFFKPRDPDDVNTGAKPKITVSARNQIFISGRTSMSTSIKPHRPDNQLVSQPCFGISNTQDSRVSAYIARSVVEGAGSVSLQNAAQQVYGNGIKYSELTDEQKASVAIAQSHLRSWSINRELRVVFSTECKKFVEQDQQTRKTICGNCEDVARSDKFKRALRVKPPRLENMRFIPNKFRNALADLGAKFAHIRGLSELLCEVSLFIISG